MADYFKDVEAALGIASVTNAFRVTSVFTTGRSGRLSELGSVLLEFSSLEDYYRAVRYCSESYANVPSCLVVKYADSGVNLSKSFVPYGSVTY